MRNDVNTAGTCIEAKLYAAKELYQKRIPQPPYFTTYGSRWKPAYKKIEHCDLRHLDCQVPDVTRSVSVGPHRRVWLLLNMQVPLAHEGTVSLSET